MHDFVRRIRVSADGDLQRGQLGTMASNDPNTGGTEDRYNPDEMENDAEVTIGDDS